MTAPSRCRAPRVVLVSSMSNLFHARVPLEVVRRLFEVLAATPQHTCQVLTERSTRLRRLSMLTGPVGHDADPVSFGVDQ